MFDTDDNFVPDFLTKYKPSPEIVILNDLKNLHEIILHIKEVQKEVDPDKFMYMSKVYYDYISDSINTFLNDMEDAKKFFNKEEENKNEEN